MESDNVELLFETNTISQIEEIEAKLKKEIEKKKDDLRQIIGEKYKDLIEVSDGLQIMVQRCNVIVEEISNLDRSVNQFKATVLSGAHERKDLSESFVNKEMKLKWEFSVKCKIIVKSPSKIWYYLDTNDIVSATFYYSQACFVWASLKPLFDSVKQNQSNIVTRYADIITNFSNILVDHAWSTIDYNEESIKEPESVAMSLVCISILQSLNPGQLLEMFLAHRYQQIINLFNNNSSDFHWICLNFFGNLFDSCRLGYLIFIEDMGIPNYLQRSSEVVERFCANQEFICHRQNMPLVPQDITNFHLQSSHLKSNLDKDQVKLIMLNWIKSIKDNIDPLLLAILHKVNSVVDLFAALKETNNILDDSNRLLNWTDLNGILFDNKINIWNFFLKEATMNELERLISLRIRNAYESLQDAITNRLSSSSKTPETVDFVWESGVNERNDLTLKAYAITEEDIKTCSNFENQLKVILEQLTVFNDDTSQALIPVDDLLLLQNIFNSSLSTNLNLFLSTLENADNTKSVNHLLVLANIYRTLVYSCPVFKKCHYLFSQDGTQWTNCLQSLQNTYNQLFIQFLSQKLSELTSKFTGDMSLKTLTKFLDLCLAWEEIILEETLEDGKIVKSTIKVPMQISLPLYSLLKNLNSTINQISAHTMSKTVVKDVLSKLGCNLNSFYQQLLQDLLSSKESSKSVKQTQILQFYFDLTFLEQLFGLTKFDNLINDTIPMISETLNSYATQIDPFDLHTLQPHLQSSVIRCLKSNGLLLGNLICQSTIPLLSSPSMSASTVSSQSPPSIKSETKLDTHSLMPSYSLSTKFPLLPKPKNMKT